MGQVSVSLNGRAYRLECSEGEEAHLVDLAEYLGSHVDTMRRKFGQVGDDRLILMASLVVTDELWELRRELEEMKNALAVAQRDGAHLLNVGKTGIYAPTAIVARPAFLPACQVVHRLLP
jgi:cell division protein ZapA (FtsZ GTPase activity inhibitor)